MQAGKRKEDRHEQSDDEAPHLFIDAAGQNRRFADENSGHERTQRGVYSPTMSFLFDGLMLRHTPTPSTHSPPTKFFRTAVMFLSRGAEFFSARGSDACRRSASRE